MKKLKITALIIILFFINFKINSQFSNKKWEAFGNGKGMKFGGDFINTVFYDSVENLLYVGGAFANIDNVDSTINIAVWNGKKWDNLGYGTYNVVYAITKYKGKIYVGGGFEYVDYKNLHAPGIATWDGNKWDTLPYSFDYDSASFDYGVVLNFKVYKNELYVVGGFSKINGVEMNGIAKWDGTNWHSVYNFPFLGNNGNLPGFNDIEFCHGNIYAAGEFYNSINGGVRDIIMYDGTSWHSVGTPPGMYGSWNTVHDMEVYKGDLYVVGSIYKAAGNTGNFIQRWDGEQWHEVGGSLWGVQGRTLLSHHGYLYVGGFLTYAGKDSLKVYDLARWDGNQWCGYDSYTDATVVELATYRDTLVIAGGFLTVAGDTIKKIAKYTGGDWVDFCGIEYNPKPFSSTLLVYPNPSIGYFSIETKHFKGANVKIYNVTGKLVFEKQLTEGITEINLNKQSAGVFFVKVVSGDTMEVGKIVLR